MADLWLEFRAQINGDLYTQKRSGAGERHLNPSLPKQIKVALGISTEAEIAEKEGEIRVLRKELQEKSNQFAESNVLLSK